MSKIKEVIILFLVFLMIIQSVSAISNVQHSVDGNKVTLTYQGTPPYWINIRPNTNIGQNGGYLWAKTYSNSFTYDMSFAINPSKKFYYGVKDSVWSNSNSFLLNGDKVDLLIFLSPQYSSDSRIESALNAYGEAIRNDINWKIKIIRLDGTSNTLGKIRETIKHYYEMNSIKAALLIGEDTKTAFAGEINNEDRPSTIIWEELNQPFNYADFYWDGSNWIEIDWENRGSIYPQNTSDEIDNLLNPPEGRRIDLIGATWLEPDVFISLLYPPKGYTYSEKVDKIVFALNKFSNLRNKNYGNTIQVYKWKFGDLDGFDIDSFSGLGTLNKIYDCNPCNFNLINQYKLFIADGHAIPENVQISPHWNDAYPPLVTAEILEKLKVPVYIGHGCYIDGWYSANNPNGVLDMVSKNRDGYLINLTVEQIFNSDDLRILMLGVGDGNSQQVSYANFISALNSGKTIAEAYTSGNRALSHTFFGDPTFHYG